MVLLPVSKMAMVRGAADTSVCGCRDDYAALPLIAPRTPKLSPRARALRMRCKSNQGIFSLSFSSLCTTRAVVRETRYVM